MDEYNLQEKKENVLDVRILGINEVNGGNDLNIPVFILFRALGIESDKDIINLIIYEKDDDSLKNQLFNLLLPCVKHSQPI